MPKKHLTFYIFILLFVACRQDVLLQTKEISDVNVSKLKFIKLKDIPNVEQYIYSKSGRNDFVLPLDIVTIKNSGKQNIIVGEIETNTIVQVSEGADVFYVFKINIATSTNAIYNLEVKETSGNLVKAEIIEYLHVGNSALDFSKFQGSVSSYSLTGDPISTLDYINGSSDCPPTGASGGNGGGSNPVDGSGGNPSPGNSTPFPGVYPGPTGPPGGSGDSDSFANPCDTVDIINDGVVVGVYYPCNGGVHYLSTANKLSADCGEGSGVIIQPNITLCEKIKKTTDDTKYKSNITLLEGTTGQDHENGYRLGTSVAGTSQSGTQSQLLQNKTGSKEIDLKAFSSTFALMHTHYDGLYPIFSPPDIIYFNNWIVWAKAWNEIPTNTPKIPINNLTLTLVTSYGNFLLAFDGTQIDALPNYTEEETIDLIKTYKKNYLDNTHTNGNFEIDKVKEEFLKFVSVNMNMTGLKLYEVKSDGNYEITINDTDGTKCP